jgi:serine/threonine protein kinase
MEILIGFLSDSDLPSKIIIKENAVTDEIKMQQQTKVLIKTIRRDQDERTLNEFRRQVDLYCHVDSENVVKLFGLSKEAKIYGMILEHDDELKSLLTEKIDISFSELLKFCHQLASGINVIHKKAKLTHR